MYQFHQNTLTIPAKALYEELGVMSEANYKKQVRIGRVNRVRMGKGLDNHALVEFDSIPERFRVQIVKKIGYPPKKTEENLLMKHYTTDYAAIGFYAGYKIDDFRTLDVEVQQGYVSDAQMLNTLDFFIKDKIRFIKSINGKVNLTSIWENAAAAVQELKAETGHDLPKSVRRLKEKLERYKKEGYIYLISGNFGNQKAIKINDDIGDFLLAYYSLPIKLTIPMVHAKYEDVRMEKGWVSITESAIYNFLYKPENERIWTLARHGKQSYVNKFQHAIKRDKSKWFPNIYWAIDGTKLDWIHYEDTTSNKMGAKLRINVIFDVYSEKIIGWSFSETEDHTDHFRAVKMAVNHAEKRPYLFTYDNQSGHKSARMQELYSNIVAVEGGVHYPHPAYKKNNPAEQLFKRIQQQVITKFWNSDGQSITVKKEDNKPNLDFITENKHLLKSKEDLLRAWETAVNMWNGAKHPHFEENRNEVYQHEMAMSEKLSYSDIMRYMWIDETKGNTYRREGITLTLQNRDYRFEVYNRDKTIDLEFRRKNIGKKFIIRYDPENLDVFVQLYEVLATGEKVFAGNAEPKRMHIDIPVLMEDGDKQAWEIDYKIREEEYQRDLQAVKDLQKRTGINPDKMIEDQELLIKFKGNLPKKEAIALDAESEILQRI